MVRPRGAAPLLLFLHLVLPLRAQTEQVKEFWSADSNQIARVVWNSGNPDEAPVLEWGRRVDGDIVWWSRSLKLPGPLAEPACFWTPLGYTLVILGQPAEPRLFKQFLHVLRVPTGVVASWNVQDLLHPDETAAPGLKMVFSGFQEEAKTFQIKALVGDFRTVPLEFSWTTGEWLGRLESDETALSNAARPEGSP